MKFIKRYVAIYLLSFIQFLYAGDVINVRNTLISYESAINVQYGIISNAIFKTNTKIALITSNQGDKYLEYETSPILIKKTIPYFIPNIKDFKTINMNTILYGDSYGYVSIYNTRILTREVNLKLASKDVRNILISKDQRYYLMSGDNSIFITDSNLVLKKELEEHTSIIEGIALSNDNKYLVSADISGKIIIWDFETGKKTRVYNEIHNVVNSVLIDNIHKEIIACSDNGYIYFINIETGKLTNQIKYDNKRVRSVELSKDCKKLFSTGDDKKIKIWDTESKKILFEFNINELINKMEINEDGNKLITVGYNSIKLWKIN